MLAPLVAALSLGATFTWCEVPRPAAAPEPPPTPMAVAGPVTAPAPWPAMAPVVIDGPASPPARIEWVMPAAAPRRREIHTDTMLAVPRGTELALSNAAGRIVVQAWKRAGIRIVAEHARRDRLEPRFENGRLTVRMVDRHGAPAFGDLVVWVPDWMPLLLNSIESGIDVEGVRAAIQAGSVRGDVVVRQSRGPLQLSSVEGGVSVLDARGRVRVTSINNLVRLERVAGLIDAESVNGDIQLLQVESPDVDASSVNGSVDFDGPFQPRGRYRLASHSGNLRVGVPVDAGVDVSVATFHGAFESGFPIQVIPRNGKGRRFTFTLGGGGSSLELQSFQGLIRLMQEDVARQSKLAPRAPEEDER